MQVAGIIAEYNPLHAGHVRLFRQVRAQLGRESGILCVMSGNFVQRGDLALVGKHARARAAVESGADLVLELPLPWAISSAERFAAGGVSVLSAAGVADYLAFGSECGDASALHRAAEVLLDDALPALLRRELAAGVSFPAARQRAAAALGGAETAALLAQPNNLLGVEYCKALIRTASPLQVMTVPRLGTPHGGEELTDGLPSASLIRRLAEAGERERALELMAPAMRRAWAEEEAAGRAPVLLRTCERAVLARLRMMEEDDFAVLDEGREGLYHRLFAAKSTASSLEEVLAAAKTKRYAQARLRRMVLWAFLGLTPADVPAAPPYLRVLAANAVGRKLLGQMRTCAAVPVLTKPADVRHLPPEAQRLFALEARATDLYTLAYPRLEAARGGSEWRTGPVIL